MQPESLSLIFRIINCGGRSRCILNTVYRRKVIHGKCIEKKIYNEKRQKKNALSPLPLMVELRRSFFFLLVLETIFMFRALRFLWLEEIFCNFFFPFNSLLNGKEIETLCNNKYLNLNDRITHITLSVCFQLYIKCANHKYV